MIRIGFYEKLSLEKNLLLYEAYGVNLNRADEIYNKMGLLEQKYIGEQLSAGEAADVALVLNYQPKILFWMNQQVVGSSDFKINS